MFTFIFLICMFGIFGKLIGVAFEMAWGITKVVFTLVFLPIIILGCLLKGLLVLAVPLLAIVGLVTIIKSLSNAA
ncbi:MAG: hypothetical protein K6A05_08720 [Lachnospiraceae bacterium]|nr:hypothetical protein [Lachnospiraceae bacterium]